MNDFLERIQSELKSSFEKLQESSAFIQLKEKFDELNPAMQKVTLFGGGALFLYFVLSFPMGYFSSSQVYVQEFEDRRALIREMMKVARESSDAPNLPVPPDLQSLKGRIQSELQGSRVLPEQIKEINEDANASQLVPQNMAANQLRVSLTDLTVRQVNEIGYSLQSISPSIKLQDLQITASATKPNYFDAVYKLVVLMIPELQLSGNNKGKNE